VALALRGVTCTYPGGTVALDDVSLTLENGIFGLLGPNGAGKSTLMRVLATLQQPDRGTVTLDGLDVLANPSAARAQLGYLPQDFGLYPNLSAEATLDHFAALKGLDERAERRARVHALLERVNLGTHRAQAVGTFSGGMRQRLGLAIALIGNPRLLILDEPTSGLDPAERHRLYDHLVDIGSGVIVLLSTHLVEDIAAVAPSLAILHRGRLVREGTCASLLAPLRGRVWRVPTTNRADDAPAHWPAGARQLSRRRAAGALVARVLADARPRDDATPVDPTLEDAYFDAVGGAEAADQST
jgi:ABC-type multidrug transport system ATPase subunit